MCKTGLKMLVSGASRIGSRIGTALACAVKWLRQTPCNDDDIFYNTPVRRGYAGHKAAAARRAKKGAAARRARQASAAARMDAGATAASSILGFVCMSVKAAYNKMMWHASCLCRRAWEKIAFSVTRPLRRTIRLRFPSKREIVVVEVLPWTLLSSIVKKRCWYDGEEVDTTCTLFSLGIVPGSTLTCLGRHRSRAPPCTSSASPSSCSPRASSTWKMLMNSSAFISRIHQHSSASANADEFSDVWKKRVEFADRMMQILIDEEEAEKMRREKDMLAKKGSRLKSSRKAALKGAGRSSATTCRV
jgi:hypothetical protein